jgi:hypothetical protein
MFWPWLLAIFRELVSFLMCAAYAPTYMAEILCMIKIVVMKIDHHHTGVLIRVSYPYLQIPGLT